MGGRAQAPKLAIILLVSTDWNSVLYCMNKMTLLSLALTVMACKSTTVKTAQAAHLETIENPILNPYEISAFWAYNKTVHAKFGTPRSEAMQKRKKYGNTVVMQRSGRNRLYDHNIFLKALLDNKISSESRENLGESFQGAVFLDIGSAILFGEGAETVRDLYDDKRIRSRLTLVASDINDRKSPKSMYVKIYEESGNKLPFPVVEVSMRMIQPKDFTGPLAPYLKKGGAVILRSSNSGPDLYYSQDDIKKHLTAAIVAFADRELFYIFGKFILYKPKDRMDFLVAGEFDDSVATNHIKATWEDIDWSKRTFNDGIRLNLQHLQYTP